jgi:aspartate/glutamate racemase
MKTIGLIGGMSWESSLLYYQTINQRVKEKLGGHHSAKSLKNHDRIRTKTRIWWSRFNIHMYEYDAQYGKRGRRIGIYPFASYRRFNSKRDC